MSTPQVLSHVNTATISRKGNIGMDSEVDCSHMSEGLLLLTKIVLEETALQWLLSDRIGPSNIAYLLSQ